MVSSSNTWFIGWNAWPDGWCFLHPVSTPIMLPAVSQILTLALTMYVTFVIFFVINVAVFYTLPYSSCEVVMRSVMHLVLLFYPA